MAKDKAKETPQEQGGAPETQEKDISQVQSETTEQATESTKETVETTAVETNKTKEPKKETGFDTKAKELFKLHPLCKELHFTTDGYAFFEKADAQNHVRTLEKKEVTTIKK